ncbi:MAG: exosortase/archaeosortase family protein [Isosphaeraceae bacterium]|nr:exosortase/archaeosortase family protein [Isosphaeraceae bacterium]
MSSSPLTRPAGPIAVVAPTRERPPLVELVRASYLDPERRPALLGAVACTAALALLYAPNLVHFVSTWSRDENYSHGFLVPLISLWFANEAARRGPVERRSGVAIGIALMLLGILARLVTVALPVFFISDLAFLVTIAGMIALLFGRSALARYGFAVGFLVFMIPLPVALYAAFASPLQLAVSRIASGLLTLSGIPALCEGNLITLPGDVKMFVAEACSGMRQLTGFLALTTACAWILRRPIWYRAALVAASIPIAMTANVIRVTFTGIITYRLDAKYASGAFHTVEGLVMMGLGLLLLQGVRLVLDQVIALTSPLEPSAPAPRAAATLSTPS